MKSAPTPPTAEITCENCQACCCRQDAMLFGDRDVPIKYLTRNSHGSLSMLRLADGLCAALDRTTWKCTIYEVRPWICREFAMGSTECLEAREELP